jgi:hypothetical protein
MASRGVSRLDPEGSRNKRVSNLENSISLLESRGIEYEQKSPHHFVVTHNGKIADFWPTTGQYAIRCSKPRYLRGVFNLMKDLAKGEF